MATIQILRRERILTFPSPGNVQEVVQVNFSSDQHPPLILNRPLDQYRAATAVEISADPRSPYVPKDPPAAAAEQKALTELLQSRLSGGPSSFEV